jgi:hypothetical protein
MIYNIITVDFQDSGDLKTLIRGLVGTEIVFCAYGIYLNTYTVKGLVDTDMSYIAIKFPLKCTPPHHVTYASDYIQQYNRATPSELNQPMQNLMVVDGIYHSYIGDEPNVYYP